jgi:hypothetical protein
VQDALERFIVESGLTVDDVRTIEDDGIVKYGFCIDGTTCLVSLYDYTQEDLSLPFIFAEFGVGIVSRSEAHEKIAEACAVIYECSYPLRIGVPPLENDCLLTLALRCEAGAFQPRYLIEMIEAAAGVAVELRGSLHIGSITKSMAS